MTNRLMPWALFALTFLLFVFSSALFGALLPRQLAIIAVELTAFLGTALFFRRVRPEPPEGWPTALALRLPVWAVLALPAVAVVLGVTSNFMAGLIAQLVPGMDEVVRQYTEQLSAMLDVEDPLLATTAILSVTVFAPLCEEFLFRGALLPSMMRHEGASAAIVLNGLLFGLIHMNPVSFLPLSLLGMFFAHLTVRTGSIWPAVLAHVSVNTFNGVVLRSAFPELSDPNAEPELWVLAVGCVVGAGLSALAWWVLLGALGRPHRTTP
ncbi:MAG: type II CAAX endopeptidase family protein [Myxococcota bacterium]